MTSPGVIQVQRRVIRGASSDRRSFMVVVVVVLSNFAESAAADCGKYC